MTVESFYLKMKDNTRLNLYQWSPDDEIEVRGIILISHGMQEEAKRYGAFAHAMTNEGIIVFAPDQRGHGKTCGYIEELGYVADKDGFDIMVEDLKEVTDYIIDKYNTLPIILGHSLGSFLAERFIEKYGSYVKGAILSGSNKHSSITIDGGIALASVACFVRGRKTPAKVMEKLVFGKYNSKITDLRTNFDWLSRDKKEVDKYINNPFCGTVFPNGFYYDLFKGLKELNKKSNLIKVPKNLPIYIISGTADPVGEYGEGVMELINEYKDLKLENLTYKLYEGGRHEMLNEINKQEVIQDILSWLDKLNITEANWV